MTNTEIRECASKNNVKLWQIAEWLGVHETTFIKRMRRELSDQDKEVVLNAIKELAQEGEKNEQ